MDDLAVDVALLRQAEPSRPSATEPIDAALIDELLGYIQCLDKTRLEARLAEYGVHTPFVTMLHRVLVPLMHRLGDLWAAQKISIASERFATMMLKQRLLTMLHITAPGTHTPLLLCACPAGEFHELGLLAFAYAMQQHGWQVCYLGPDLPLHELRWSCQHLRPALVALSFTHVTSTADCYEAVQEIDASLAPVYPTVVGGQAIRKIEHRLHPHFLCLGHTPQAALSHVGRQPAASEGPEKPTVPLGKPSLSP